ncbi:MAG: filamentous hemagglutinin N-terminal domain-containing protein [Cyanothece sp. SIO1E1]|nr:filamentous hemagglutinin N-terminal domain-containing protein [Cyanothece sp. SIO1E1]
MTPRFLISSVVTAMVWGIMASPGRSQVIPDATLPTNSVVPANCTTCVITGGTRSVDNRLLFQSFEQFSIPTGGAAIFQAAPNLPMPEIIFSRVTGGQLSNIDGLIETPGTADLFLLNPSGIVFGPNASLNIGGAFVASTAESVQFADGTSFSATAPNAPPLLTINVPIGLQFGATPAPIINQSVADSAVAAMPPVGLETSGRTLALVGGDLSLAGGNLTAGQGNIELGSVASSGLVSLTPTNTGFTLGYEDISSFGNIELSNAASVNASGLGGGTIRVRGGEVTLTEAANLVAENFGDLPGGGIDIQATELSVRDQAFVSTSTFGSGMGGNLTIRADSVELTGTNPFVTTQQLLSGAFDPLNLQDGLYSLSVGSGAAGDITIDAGQLKVQNGASLATTALASGLGGDLNLNIAGLAEFNTGSLVATGTVGVGNAGAIAITAQDLQVLGGTSVTTSPNIMSTGAGGALTITADTVELRETPAGAVVPGGLFTTTLGAGGAGDLTVMANQVRVAEGNQVSTSTSGQGMGGILNVTANVIDLDGQSTDGRFLSGLFSSASLLIVPGQSGDAPAGDITVTAETLNIQDGGQISAATGSEGAAGNLNINASESVNVVGFATGVDASVEAVSFGILEDGIVPSAIESNTAGGGRAGDLNITTEQLNILDGAEVGVRSTGSGQAGNLNFKADAILLANQGTVSAVATDGNGGNIEFNSRQVELNNGIINASVSGGGTGGNITIRAVESVEVLGNGLAPLLETIFIPALSGSLGLDGATQGIVALTAGDENAGDITIATERFVLANGGVLGTATLGDGSAGDLRIDASESVEITSSFVSASTLGMGNGGDIKINTGTLVLQDLGVVSVTTLGPGPGGSLTIRASESVEVSGTSPDGQIPTNLTAGSPVPVPGIGGDISIETPELVVRDGAEVSVSSVGQGNAGDIMVDAPLLFLDSGNITATSILGEGGDIDLQVQTALVLSNQSQISTTAGTEVTGGGDGGNITITAGLVAIVEDSFINANAFEGTGGNILITASDIFSPSDSAITASSQLGFDGIIEINTPDVNPSAVLVELSANLIDSSNQIVAGCPADQGNRFVVAGQGGLPTSPTQLLQHQLAWQDWRFLSRLDDTDIPVAATPKQHPVKSLESAAPLVEATEWVRNESGQIALVAQNAASAPGLRVRSDCQ